MSVTANDRPFMPPGYRQFAELCTEMTQYDLHTKLATGELRAARWDRLNGKVESIPANFWLSAAAEAVFRHFYRTGFDRAVYLFRRGLAHRPLLIEGAAPELKTTVAAERRCEQWLIEKMKKPKGQTKTAIQTEALETFPDLSEKGFGRAWDTAKKADSTDSSWHKSGPPKSS